MLKKTFVEFEKIDHTVSKTLLLLSQFQIIRCFKKNSKI